MTELFDRFAKISARLCGSAAAFILSLAVVIVWCVTGPLFGFSDTWQLVINTGTTVVTFLMIFLVQNSQNRDTLAIETKLDQLIAATDRASNRVLGMEELPEAEQLRLRREVRL